MLRAVVGAYRLTSADAADVVQTTWMRLAENIDRLEDPSRVGAWLATTARRECVRTLRHLARELPNEQPEPTDLTVVPIDRIAIRGCGRRSAGSPFVTRGSFACWWRSLSPATRRSPQRSACRSEASVRPADGRSSACGANSSGATSSMTWQPERGRFARPTRLSHPSRGSLTNGCWSLPDGYGTMVESFEPPSLRPPRSAAWHRVVRPETRQSTTTLGRPGPGERA